MRKNHPVVTPKSPDKGGNLDEETPTTVTKSKKLPRATKFLHVSKTLVPFLSLE